MRSLQFGLFTRKSLFFANTIKIRTYFNEVEYASSEYEYESSSLKYQAITQIPSKIRRERKPTVQAHVITSPNHTNCEDAFFISDDGTCFGVADGVGIWSELGTDPAVYSTSLLENIKNYLDENKNASLYNALRFGHKQNFEKNIEGSCTVCLAQIKDGNLFTLNLGDSGFAVFRNGEFIFKSDEQTHSFNYPYQLGAGGDSPSCAERCTIKMKKGDVVVLGTDGLFDNLYPGEIADIIKKSDSDKTAFNLAVNAMASACCTRKETPFGDRVALETDHIWNGGKMDDVTVISCNIN